MQSASSSSGLVGHRRRSALGFCQATNQAKWVIIDLISPSTNIKSPHHHLKSHQDSDSMSLSAAGLTAVTLSLYRVNQTAAGFIVDHISPALRSLHRLPVCPGTDFMIPLFVYKALNDLRPETFLMCCDINNCPELSECPGQASLLSLLSKLNTEM